MIIDYLALIFCACLVVYFAYHIYDGCKTLRALNKAKAKKFEADSIEEFREALTELDEALEQLNKTLDKFEEQKDKKSENSESESEGAGD